MRDLCISEPLRPKEAAGKASGQKTREMEGKIEKGVGKAQTKIGDKQEEHRSKKDSRR